jgi:murein DD-endopeptidase MepM/ murein hydrolase activator NlpD
LTRKPIVTLEASAYKPTSGSDSGLASILPESTSAKAVQTQNPILIEISEIQTTSVTPEIAEEYDVSPTLLPNTQIPEIAKTTDISPIVSTKTPSGVLTGSGNFTETPPGSTQKMILYYSQAGDTLSAVSVRFGVPNFEITSPQDIPNIGLLNPKQLLVIPNKLTGTGPGGILMPDSEVVYSPSALDFDIEKYVNDNGGYLSTYREYLTSGWHSGAEVIQRVAIENSINPRLLLSLLEFRSQWVTGKPPSALEVEYPISHKAMQNQGLYHQLSWAVQQFSIGYYGWRAGLITTLTFPDGSHLRIAPELNAGTVAVQYLFAKIENQDKWGAALYSPGNLSELHERMFGNPWLRAQTVEPLYPTDLRQPRLELPFKPGASWSLSGGPHSAWGPDGALAALDFAPPSNFHGCAESIEWVTASAPGLVVRSANGVVIVDLDGDGYEQTGWAILYLHIATQDRIPAGTWLNQDDKIGRPSCEGGLSTGTHVHIARKYNGEWILADGPMPFVLSGWVAHAGEAPYLGKLTKDDMVAVASTSGIMDTLTKRSKEE